MITVKELREKMENNDFDSRALAKEEYELLQRLMLLKRCEGKIVRHFKGKYYMILGIAKNTETLDELVIYKALYGECEVFARPIDMFLSKVDKEKYPDARQEYRLEFVTLQQ